MIKYDCYDARMVRSLLLLLAMTFPISAATFQSDDGVTLHYETVGKGSPVLLLSGGPGFSSDYMRAVAEPLKKRYKFVLLDQRGTGKSLLEKYDATTLDHKKLVADVDALRRVLKVNKLTIVGHSWGGILSMLYASEHPDRINALILVDAGGPTLQSLAKFTANHTARMTPEDTARVAEWYGKIATDHKRAILEITKARTPPYFHDPKKAKAFADALTEESFNDKAFWPIVNQITPAFDLRPGLQNLKAPVLIIHGKSDPLETAEELHEVIPGSRVELIENAGHFPWAEQPETFTRLLDAFLREVVKR
jgi:proline iminopeptidase